MRSLLSLGVPSAAAIAALVLGFGPLLCSASTGVRFLGRDEGSDRTVAARNVESSLQASLDAVLRGGEGAAASRLARIKASMWPTFQALPKNSMGRLAPRSVRYVVHGYFAKEHGWLIKGLEPHGMQLNMTEVQDVSILQDKAPALVEALLEARRSDHGLSLDDVVAMAAALERLIFEESIGLLEAAYTLNGQSAATHVDESALHGVLTSYLLVFEMGVRGNLSDIRRHQAIKKKVAAAGGSWLTLVEFEHDAVQNFAFSHRDHTNPFVPHEYSFKAASQIVEDLAQDYGKWQNTECRQMKDGLIALDPDGSGRVPLSTFYSQPETADYQFTESVEYLRQIGALDESEYDRPKVRIANYMVGPSNCIASSSYYSVCCLSDCEGLMSELEGQVRAPTTTPERLLGVVGNLSSPSVDAPRKLPVALEERLHAIAAHHGGAVPLHGRLFAQWMHFAFPSECPHPHASEDPAVLTPRHWLNKKTTAPQEVRELHVQAVDPAAAATEPPALQWSDDEVLPLQEPQNHRDSALSSIVRAAVQIMLLVVLLRTLFAGLCTAGLASGMHEAKHKEDGFVLPIHC
eukprot:CAMPEP_0179133300 /NCGR_PEP_ID=MMETSP0796-20121207/63385_1 /TAXON_ID=73915 /ORGANISM="Pyrodinium bahamense, Strain pbaha01" /LENGTH=575 /DNA_ID=CAMNT_0020832259 /DNA_START=114 /DNA_END=1841 /DNA_ORIENTATION=+